jgi:two-component system LytT family response regulator
MPRAILIDDEKHCNETLRFELSRHCPEIEILDEATSGASGIQKIQQHKPDLVFLDIEMPGMSGFEMLRRLEPIQFHVIFVTAYDQYAIQAFRFAALDYLLKPVISTHLKEAVDRVSSALFKGNYEMQLQTLMHNVRDGLKSPRIALPAGRGMDFVTVADILYCMAESNYTHIHMRDGKKYTMSKTLKDIELLLDAFHFFRIHQSYLINVEHIMRYVRDDGGYVIMNDGAKIQIAQRRKEEFLALMKN